MPKVFYNYIHYYVVCTLYLVQLIKALCYSKSFHKKHYNKSEKQIQYAKVHSNFLVGGTTHRYIHFLMGEPGTILTKKTTGCINKNWHLFVNAKRLLVIHAFTKKKLFPLPQVRCYFVLAFRT